MAGAVRKARIKEVPLSEIKTLFDVPDFREVIPKRLRWLRKGFVTEHDFREFTFTNAAMLHTRNNPGFFKGTVVEQAVADELGLERAAPAANI